MRTGERIAEIERDMDKIINEMWSTFQVLNAKYQALDTELEYLMDLYELEEEDMYI